MQFTFGFSFSSDPGGWYTLNALKIYHDDLLDRAEILVVDNSPPGCPISQEFATHVRSNHGDVRYIRDDGPPSSCLYKNRLFQDATGDVVICVDAHVLLTVGSVDAIVRYFENNPESRDLLTGTLQNAAGKVMATNQVLYESEHYEIPRGAALRRGVVCRGGQLGAWVTDPRGLDRDGAPYEIQMNGSWLLAMRKKAWPGFHPMMYGFGGNEPYLYEKVRKGGGRVLNHPGIRGTHNFSSAHGRGYQPLAEDKIRNYLVAALDLERMDLYEAALEHFATIHPSSIAQAVASAEKVMRGEFTPRPHAPRKTCEGGGACAARKADAARPRGVYERYIEQWELAGGDVGGSIPKPLFVQLVHTRPETAPDSNGDQRPTRTLEFGSGLSTIGFDRQGTIHTAIEHDRKWIERVRSQLKGDKVEIIHAPIKNDWYDWRPPFGTLYDVILIDGPPGSIGREGCVEIVKEILAPGGVIYIDDTHREAERSLSDELSRRMEMRVRRQEHGARAFDVLTPLPEPLGDGPGSELLAFMKSLPKMPTCQLCHNLARKMNQWGVAGCQENEDYIVEDMLGRARHWWKASSPWMKAEAWFAGQGSLWNKLAAVRGMASLDVDRALRESIRQHVRAAIARSAEKQLESSAKQSVEKQV